MSIISPIFKTLVLLSIFPFCSICQLFCHILFTSLSVTPLLYIQPLDWIMVIISKNSTALLSINIAEKKSHDRLLVELNSFSCKTVIENYVKHSSCCLYIITDISNWKIFQTLLHQSCYLFTSTQLVLFCNLNEVTSCRLSLLIV